MKCTSLVQVKLPSSVKSIEKNAFYGCKGLKTVQFKGKTPPQLEKNCFKGINRKARFKVPQSSLSEYKKKHEGK